MLAGLPQITFKRFWCLRGSRKSLLKGFDACGLPANHFLKDLALAGLPQIIPQKVWCFRAWRKSFPEVYRCHLVMQSASRSGLRSLRSLRLSHAMFTSTELLARPPFSTTRGMTPMVFFPPFHEFIKKICEINALSPIFYYFSTMKRRKQQPCLGKTELLNSLFILARRHSELLFEAC